MKQAIQDVVNLAKKNPNENTWRGVVWHLDRLSIQDQEEAADAFNEASKHWPTAGADPFGVKPREIRASPGQYGWSQEIVSGASYPKHRVLRSLSLPSNRWSKDWKASNLHASTNLLNVVNVWLIITNKNPVTIEMLKEWQGEGMWQRWQSLQLAYFAKATAKELSKARLDALRSLSLDVKPGALDALWKAAPLPKLEDLKVTGIEDAATLDSLAKVPWMRGLQRLGFQYAVLDEARVAALAGACGLETLTQLDLSISRLSTDIKTIPLQWMAKLKKLKRLRLESVLWPDADMAPLLARLPDLEGLHVGCELGKQSTQAIAQHQGKWRALAFSRVGPDCEAAYKEILRAPSTDNLEHLSFGPGLSPKVLQLLLDGACPKLKSFRYNGYTPELLAFLEQHPKLRAMTFEKEYSYGADNGYPHEELKLSWP